MGQSPTFRGFVENASDAYRLIEAIFTGKISLSNRWVNITQNTESIVSGDIFICQKGDSAFNHEDDGIHWSQSSVLGNFRFYRQLSANSPREPSVNPIQANHGSSSPFARYEDPIKRASMEQALVPGLTDFYDFEKGGLVKKIIGITFAGYIYYIISYYSIEDALNKSLVRIPKSFPEPRDELVTGHGNKLAVDDEDVFKRLNSNSTATYVLPPPTGKEAMAPLLFYSQHNTTAQDLGADYWQIKESPHETQLQTDRRL